MTARVAFDGWLFDWETRQLTQDGREVHLSPKAFDLLATLLLNRPRALGKADLLQRLWPETFVCESNLASLVTEVRAGLEDDARAPRYVRTVHGFGYAFCGSTIELDGRPSCGVSFRLFWGDREIALEPGLNLIGRCDAAAVWIDSRTVSRRHALISISDRSAAIEDLGSKNGSFVGGERLDTPRPLADWDEIRLGDVTLMFRALDGTQPTTTFAGH